MLDSFIFFFFNDTATTEIYTLSLHDALPILVHLVEDERRNGVVLRQHDFQRQHQDRKSTRLNSSHSQISYAVFCLKKKKKHKAYTINVVSLAHSSTICLLASYQLSCIFEYDT